MFKLNWTVLSTSNKEAGGGRNSRNYLGPRTIGFPSSYSSVWIRSHSRLDANHVIRPLLSPACTFSPCVTQPVIAKAILFPGLNDATSAVESFPVLFLSFPQAFTPPTSRRIGQMDPPLSSFYILLCWFVYWDHPHWSPEDYCLARPYRGFRCTFPSYSLFFTPEYVP